MLSHESVGTQTNFKKYHLLESEIMSLLFLQTKNIN